MTVSQTTIVFCPVDCTPIDVSPDAREHECLVCGQKFTMEIDLERIAEHSPA